MFLAQENIGIYYELELLIDYNLEDKEEEEWLNYFLVKFRNEGLTHEELKDAIGMIEDYLPKEIECDSTGCYIVNEIDGEPAQTYLPKVKDLPVINLVREKPKQLLTV